MKNIIGKRITNIFQYSKMEFGGLDEAFCYLELNNEMIIEFPYILNENIELQTIPYKTKSLFEDLSDIPTYQINPYNLSIQDIAKRKEIRQKSWLGRFLAFFGIKENIPLEYQIHQVTYRENQLKYLKNQRIVDFLFKDDDSDFEKGYFLLENGYVITEMNFAPHGTGSVGLHFHKFTTGDFKDYRRWSETSKR